jgi:type VI protein secretion system component VasF
MAKESVLAELCEPIFQYVCRLNRMGRKGGKTDQNLVKQEFKNLFQQVRTSAEQAQLLPAFLKSEIVLTFFVDSMILNSKLSFQGGWKPLSHEKAEMSFEEKFWDLLEEHLRDTSDDSTQVLGVFYVCIGLGFTGLYMGQHGFLKQKMLEISARLRGMIDADWSSRLCAEAYENVDTRNLTQPPNRTLVLLLVGVILFAAAMLVGYVQMFKQASEKLGGSLTSITKTHEDAGKPGG